VNLVVATLLDPSVWIALAALVTMEVALGVDNIIMVAVLAESAPAKSRAKARRIGLSMALVLRLALLGMLFGATRLTTPMTWLGLTFSWRDLTFLAGGLFLIYKGTREIRARVAAAQETSGHAKPAAKLLAVIGQIIVLD
jgi:predicted tellurium resistance membrane protein TerC